MTVNVKHSTIFLEILIEKSGSPKWKELKLAINTIEVEKHEEI
jgi:hypothetical protein